MQYKYNIIENESWKWNKYEVISYRAQWKIAVLAEIIRQLAHIYINNFVGLNLPHPSPHQVPQHKLLELCHNHNFFTLCITHSSLSTGLAGAILPLNSELLPHTSLYGHPLIFAWSGSPWNSQLLSLQNLVLSGRVGHYGASAWMILAVFWGSSGGALVPWCTGCVPFLPDIQPVSPETFLWPRFQPLWNTLKLKRSNGIGEFTNISSCRFHNNLWLIFVSLGPSNSPKIQSSLPTFKINKKYNWPQWRYPYCHNLGQPNST